MHTRRFDLPVSLWESVTPPGPAFPELEGVVRADVAVVGAGFVGLSAALHLREAGVEVSVIEAAEPGFGAAGRNNGQVIPTLSRVDPDEIVARFGDAGERFVPLVRDSALMLFDTVRRKSIAAEAEQTGWIQPVHSPGRIRIAERRVRQWLKWHAPVELLSREQASAMLGSRAWHGGFWNRSGGHINPLALTRGLARVFADEGGTLYVGSPVSGIERREARWILTTPKGSVSARALILATNAYTGEVAPTLMPALAREFVPVVSWQMATTSLAADVRGTIIPGRQAMSDTHGELYFARLDARNRLVTGGALMLPVNSINRLKTRIGTRLKRLFPQIGEVSFDYVWNGLIAMTPDYLPRFHRIGPDAYAWAGCNGRAVALAFGIGRELARAAQGVPDKELAIPFSEPTPLPLHSLVRRLAPLMLAVYRYRDRREMK